MGWIKNTNENKPKIDKKYKDQGYSVEVIIHLKNDLNFLGYYDYFEKVWWSEITRIPDNDVLFWCKLPKLPKEI